MNDLGLNLLALGSDPLTVEFSVLQLLMNTILLQRSISH